MSKTLSAKYYQENKERLQKSYKSYRLQKLVEYRKKYDTMRNNALL